MLRQNTIKIVVITLMCQSVMWIWILHKITDIESGSKLENSHKENRNLIKPKAKYKFNCTNIKDINFFKYDVGDGLSKSVDIGTYEGETVVVKRISPHKNPKDRDAQFREVLFMKDILMQDQLDHPALIKMLGYCVKHLRHDNSYDGFKKIGDISAVYEYGKQFDINKTNLTTEVRLNYALDIADFIFYLHHSPLGSLKLVDFMPNDHFFLVNGQIKMIDMDFTSDVEPSCQLSIGCYYYNITCQPLNSDELQNTNCKSLTNCTLGVCRGTNLKHNMARFTESFFIHLLSPEFYPVEMHQVLSQILKRLNEYDIHIDDFVIELKNIKHSYMSK